MPSTRCCIEHVRQVLAPCVGLVLQTGEPSAAPTCTALGFAGQGMVGQTTLMARPTGGHDAQRWRTVQHQGLILCGRGCHRGWRLGWLGTSYISCSGQPCTHSAHKPHISFRPTWFPCSNHQRYCHLQKQPADSSATHVCPCAHAVLQVERLLP